MPDVQWIKITTDILNDNKIRIIDTLPEADAIFRIWIGILTLAGQSNEQGFIYLSENIPYTEEMLSTVLNRPVNVIRLALGTLQRFGMIGLADNGVLYITNWEKHQNIDGIERIREQTKIRVAKHREKVKQIQCNVTGNVTVTGSNGGELEVDKDKEIDKQIPPQKQAGIIPPIPLPPLPKQEQPKSDLDTILDHWYAAHNAAGLGFYKTTKEDRADISFMLKGLTVEKIKSLIDGWFAEHETNTRYHTMRITAFAKGYSRVAKSTKSSKDVFNKVSGWEGK